MSELSSRSGPESQTLPGHSLYLHHLCYFCAKVLLALEQLGLELDQRNILQSPEHRQTLINEGGSSQVPCLRIERENGDVQWMYESSRIIEYLSLLVPAGQDQEDQL